MEEEEAVEEEEEEASAAEMEEEFHAEPLQDAVVAAELANNGQVQST